MGGWYNRMSILAGASTACRSSPGHLAADPQGNVELVEAQLAEVATP